ncbi:hypothetical protein BIW11_12346 [Tropilaelaps mercedesae]|uniref:Uncharacterized protein n=1 Tax=Tropilaelaps mercedesae TaxID=418985 RepID=A0A1V9X6U8_9ACAR|nr:hypothetical protein BIW11_12346 [Tropilaelaps mercedesae]
MSNDEKDDSKNIRVLPSIMGNDGNWKKLQIMNINAAHRAGKGCLAGPSDFVWTRFADVDVSLDYSEEILADWRLDKKQRGRVDGLPEQ